MRVIAMNAGTETTIDMRVIAITGAATTIHGTTDDERVPSNEQQGRVPLGQHVTTRQFAASEQQWH